MRRLSLALSLITGLALGLAAMRWWCRLDGDGPRPFVLLRFDTAGRPRAYGPAGERRARAAKAVVGGRMVECVELD